MEDTHPRQIPLNEKNIFLGGCYVKYFLKWFMVLAYFELSMAAYLSACNTQADGKILSG